MPEYIKRHIYEGNRESKESRRCEKGMADKEVAITIGIMESNAWSFSVFCMSFYVFFCWQFLVKSWNMKTQPKHVLIVFGSYPLCACALVYYFLPPKQTLFVWLRRPFLMLRVGGCPCRPCRDQVPWQQTAVFSSAVFWMLSDPTG